MTASPRARLQALQRREWEQCLPLLDMAFAGAWPALGKALQTVDTDTWLNFLSTQNLDDGFHWLVQRDQASANLPAWMVLHLLGANAWGKARRADLGAALGEFARVAEQAECPWLLLKGLHYSARFYDDPDARQTRDLDLLAAPESQAEITNVLAQLGYRCSGKTGIPSLVPPAMQRQLEHATTWQRGEISIDLHHAPRVRPGWQLDSAALFAGATTTSINGLLVCVPGDRDALAMLALMLTTDIEQGLVCARSLLDLQVALESLAAEFDWQAWREHCRAYGVLNEVQAALGVLGAALPGSTAASQWPDRLADAGWAYTDCSPDEALKLLCGLPYNLHNRRWFMRQYSGPLHQYLAWWLLGGFFREGSAGRLLSALRPGSATATD